MLNWPPPLSRFTDYSAPPLTSILPGKLQDNLAKAAAESFRTQKRKLIFASSQPHVSPENEEKKNLLKHVSSVLNVSNVRT